MTDEMTAVLRRTTAEAMTYVRGLAERPVHATATRAELAAGFPAGMPTSSTSALEVVEELVAAAKGGLVASGSPRYYGFVIGGALPTAIAADWLTTVWDQNAGIFAASPLASVVEETVGRWLLTLLDLPSQSSFALVTGCQMAHVTCLAAARHHVLADVGWDVERQGLIGAPPVRVLAGESVHVTVPRAMRLLGLGTDALELVPVDDDGCMRPDALADLLAAGDGPTIVCAQLGEVNTGAMDPIDVIVEVAHRAGAWVHVDGAFGLWARASDRHRAATVGTERADSWATDAHKWLNVPYDSGLAFCAHPADHRAALSVDAAYLVQAEDDRRDAVDWTPEFSRRARGFAVYAALRSLGSSGVADLVDRSCENARRFAAGLGDLPGVEVLSGGALNQVLVSFGDDDRTHAILTALQDEGTCWMSGTTWHGRAAMRVSFVNWSTTKTDVDRTLAAIAATMEEMQ